MSNQIIKMDMEFIINFAFINVLKDSGRRHISLKRIVSYTNNVMKSLNNVAPDIQVILTDIYYKPNDGSFFYYNKSEKRYVLKPKYGINDIKKVAYGAAKDIERQYNLNLLITVMESNLTSFVLFC